MLYRIGNIGIKIHPSTPQWTRQVNWAMQRQLDGFQASDESDSSAPYRINVHDYERLPTSQSEASSVVPEYCYYSDGIYVDTQQHIAFELNAHTLNVWCSTGCRGLSAPFMLQALLIPQGKTFIHAAGIDVQGSGILLPAFGGVGKTTFIAHAVKRPGVKVISDDMVIVTNRKTLEPYLRPFALYEYHRPLFPGFFADNRIRYKPLTLSWRIYNKVRNSVGARLGRDWRQPESVVRTGYLPVAPHRVLAQSSLATAPAKLDHIFLLQRSAVSTDVQLQKMEPDRAIDAMLNIMYHEWYAQLRFLLSWLTYRQISMVTHLTQVSQVLRSAIENAESINMITIPLQMKATDIAEELVHLVIQ